MPWPPYAGINWPSHAGVKCVLFRHVCWKYSDRLNVVKMSGFCFRERNIYNKNWKKPAARHKWFEIFAYLPDNVHATKSINNSVNKKFKNPCRSWILLFENVNKIIYQMNGKSLYFTFSMYSSYPFKPFISTFSSFLILIIRSIGINTIGIRA